MSEYRSGGRQEEAPAANTVSVPFLVLSSILVGVGLAGMAYWLVTFDWLYFASVIALALGAYMLFTRGTGPDRA